MTQVPLISVNGFTIADLALVAPVPGQFLEVGGATEGRIDIDALAAYITADLPSGGATVTTGNRLINGGMAVDQVNEGNAQSITAGAALAYTVDQWYAYAVGAPVTGQRVQGVTEGRFRYRFTGASGCTGIGFGQRIEQLNSADLAGQTVTLSVDIANTLLTSVTWTAYYATTKDTFGTLASPTKTQFATGTFTVNSTVTRYSTQIPIPIEAVTGIEVLFTVGAQTSGTWTIGDVQLEKGTPLLPIFHPRLYPTELALCQRYLEKSYAPGTAVGTPTALDLAPILFGAGQSGSYYFTSLSFAVKKRVQPVFQVWTYDGTAGQWHIGQLGFNQAKVTPTIYPTAASFRLSSAAALSSQNAMYGHFLASARL